MFLCSLQTYVSILSFAHIQGLSRWFSLREKKKPNSLSQVFFWFNPEYSQRRKAAYFPEHGRNRPQQSLTVSKPGFPASSVSQGARVPPLSWGYSHNFFRCVLAFCLLFLDFLLLQSLSPQTLVFAISPRKSSKATQLNPAQPLPCSPVPWMVSSSAILPHGCLKTANSKGVWLTHFFDFSEFCD